jgi:hypothetical protein
LKPNDVELAERLSQGIAAYEGDHGPLLGIGDPKAREVLIEQLLESERRVRFISTLLDRELHRDRADPSSELFDPYKAAVLHKRRGEFDEACWLVFLSVHFGKHAKSGWRYLREVYGALYVEAAWDWRRTSADPTSFREWLHSNQVELLRGDKRGFGNHRRYTSLDARSASGTGAAVQSYVEWVEHHGGHAGLFEWALLKGDTDSRKAFDALYRSMSAVASFGRLGKFDFLTMIGKLELAPIEPGSTYMPGATGPKSGACLLRTGTKACNWRVDQLDNMAIVLESYLGVGMQVMEDALCNWQKSPLDFVRFRG